MTAATLQHRGITKDGNHPRTKTSPRKAATLAGASGVLAEIQAGTEADTHSYWDDGKAQDSADNTEGVAMEGKEKTHGSAEGTEEDGVPVWDTQENASGQESVKDFVVTESRLWELHRFFNNRKGSSSSTHKKNSEANNKVYDLNQRTVSALDHPFEDT